MYNGLQAMTDYRTGLAMLTDTLALLPDQMNNFYAWFKSHGSGPEREKDCFQ